MSGLDTIPFADPFQDEAIAKATTGNANTNLENFNPFGNSSRSSVTLSKEPAHPTYPPPYTQQAPGSNLSAPPVPVPTPSLTTFPGHEELQQMQEELEKKAEELQRREQELSTNLQPRLNNWPPIPKWCPVGSCFYQNFEIDIPSEYRRTARMLYYLWIYYIIIHFTNMAALLATFIVVGTSTSTTGYSFGLSLLWLVLSPCSLCWYRPAYAAFRSNSSFYFFYFFFMIFFQLICAILMSVGILSAGWIGWITAFSYFSVNVGFGIMSCVQASLNTMMALLTLILMKRVHSIYRRMDASFEKAQAEFATGVITNPGVQTVATTAATSAVQTNLAGIY